MHKSGAEAHRLKIYVLIGLLSNVVLYLIKTTCHCEPARTLAWQSVLLFVPSTLSKREKENGLPRRFASRNDIRLIG